MLVVVAIAHQAVGESEVLLGMAPKHLENKMVPLGQGLVGYSALSNSIVQHSDARKHPSFSREYEDFIPDGPCACVCMPVTDTGKGRHDEKHKVYGVVKVPEASNTVLSWPLSTCHSCLHHPGSRQRGL